MKSGNREVLCEPDLVAGLRNKDQRYESSWSEAYI